MYRWEPGTFVYHGAVLPFRRSSSISAAARNHQDWFLPRADCGGVEFVLSGTAEAKSGFMMSLTTELSDVTGYYIIVRETGVDVVRPVIDGSFQVLYQVRRRVTFNDGESLVWLSYNNGTIVLTIDSVNVLVYRDPHPFPGITQVGMGLLTPGDMYDEVTVSRFAKYRQN